MFPVLTHILTAAIGVSVAAIYLKRKPADPCAIKHDYVVIAAQPLKSDFPLLHDQTITLQRCQRCGQHLSVNYAGNWSLDEFHRQGLADLLDEMYK